MTSTADLPDLPYGGRSALLDRALADLLEQAPELQAAAVVSFDGLPMASALPAGMDEDRVAAMSAALLSLGERAAEGLGRGELSQVYVEGENGTVFLVSAQDEAVLVAVAGRRAKVGLMLFEVRRAAHAVGAALRDEPVPTPEPVLPPTLVPLPTPPQPELAPLAPERTAPEPAPQAVGEQWPTQEPVDLEQLPPDPAHEPYPADEPYVVDEPTVVLSYEALFDSVADAPVTDDAQPAYEPVAESLPDVESVAGPEWEPSEPEIESESVMESEPEIESEPETLGEPEAATEPETAAEAPAGPEPAPSTYAEPLPEPPAAYGESWPQTQSGSWPASSSEPATPAYAAPAARWYDPSPRVAYSPPVNAPHGVWSPYPGS